MNKAKSNGEVGRSLNGTDRMNLLGLLPEKGNIQTLRLLESFRKKVAYNNREQEKFEECKSKPNEQGAYTINTGELARLIPAKTISFGGLEVKLIVEKLEKLDKDEELTPVLTPLWEAFIEKET